MSRRMFYLVRGYAAREPHRRVFFRWADRYAGNRLVRPWRWLP